MSNLHYSGNENIPSKPSLFIPNRLSLTALKKVISLLKNQLIILIDKEFTLADDIQECLKEEKLSIVAYDFRKGRLAALREVLLNCQSDQKHILFLPGKVHPTLGSLSDIPDFILKQLGHLHLSPIPIFNVHYQQNIMQLVLTAASDKSEEYLSILPQLSPGPSASERIISVWMNRGVDLFEKQPLLSESLTSLMVKSMKKYGKVLVTDGMTETQMPYLKLLGIAMAVAKKLKRENQERIGVILPPGPGAIITTMACLLADITPVMVNYASSHAAFKSIREQAGLKRFITAKRFMDKLPEFPWPENEELILVEDLLAKIGKLGLLSGILKAKLKSASSICRSFKTDARKQDDPAILLFTSGSSGEPKGVALTHKMILSNIAQCLSRLDLHDHEHILASLPVFHSFGLTVTMLMPILGGVPICTFPSPTDAKRLNELIVKYQLTLACSTPTFSRAMMRRADKNTFKSLHFFVVGAEKLQEELRLEFLENCGVELLEGYGMTEASPVCSVNLPRIPEEHLHDYCQPTQQHGSIGAIFPGLAIRLTDLDDDNKEIPLTERGMLWLRGPNVFSGYVGKPELNEGIFSEDGWFKTGDIAQMDLNGFVRLSGRLSRFSKVAGEMVPHEGVEQLVIKALDIDPNSPELAIAVTGVTDTQKGEALVLLSTLPQHALPSKEKENILAIRQYLVKEHIPSLWTPKYIVPVESIPVLPTGKLDLRACKLLAQESLGIDV